MASYSGANKAIKFLFDNFGAGSSHDYSTTSYQIGTWIDGRDMYEVVLEIQITSASSEDEVIYNLSGYADNYREIVAANLETSGGYYPILHELRLDGNGLKYTGAHGTGTAYVTIHFC